MPFSIVITREGGSDAVVAVPAGWIEDNDTLYWPKASKEELENLRCKGDGVRQSKSRKQKCRVKVTNISTFYEATRLEALYAKFDDTEDEQAYFKKKEEKRKHPTYNYIEKLDMNTEFEKIASAIEMDNFLETNTLPDQPDITTLPVAEEPTNVLHEYEREQLGDDETEKIHHINDKHVQSNSKNLTINEDQLIELIDNNNTLSEENKNLKEEVNRLSAFNLDIERKYDIIQVKLDKLIEMVKYNSVKSDKSTAQVEEGPILHDLKFPIKSQEDLDLLEDKLGDKNLADILVQKFSKICGQGGVLKYHKIGLMVMKHIISDELLKQCTWKGIKGCTKLPFIQYIRIRELIYNVLKLADHSCAAYDVDAFIQCSAIKHSAQRFKRKLDSENDIGGTKKKTSKPLSHERKNKGKSLQPLTNSSPNSEEEIQASPLENETRTITLTEDMITIHGYDK